MGNVQSKHVQKIRQRIRQNSLGKYVVKVRRTTAVPVPMPMPVSVPESPASPVIHSSAVIHSMDRERDKPPNITIAEIIKERHEDKSIIVIMEGRQSQPPPPTLQTLPFEIKFLIFTHLLPPNKRIIILTGGPDRRPSYGALSKTCRRLRRDLTYWFKSSRRLQQLYTKTVQYGLISRETPFAMRITDEFRDLEVCKVDETTVMAAGGNGNANGNGAGTWPSLRDLLLPECTCCMKFRHVLTGPDYTYIRSLLVHLKTEDYPGRRDNLNAIKRLPHMPNLSQLDFLLGDRGRCWEFCREEWRWEGRERAKVWIPTCKSLMAVLKARVVSPVEIVIRVWLAVYMEDRRVKDRVELLCAWPEVKGGWRRSFLVEGLNWDRGELK